MPKKKKQPGTLQKLFPAYYSYKKDPDASEPIGAVGGGGATWGIDGPGYSGSAVGQALSAGLSPMSGIYPGSDTEECKTDRPYRFGELPADRFSQYQIFKTMGSDPSLSVALAHHVVSALSADLNTGKAVTIESVNDRPSEEKYVDELRTRFEEEINRLSPTLTKQAGKYGISFVRVYGCPREGVTNLRNDYWTHPQWVRMYEKAGLIAGFTCEHRNYASPKYRKKILLPPWFFTFFRIPLWENDALFEPLRTNREPIDLGNEKWESEGVTETQDYGKSLFADAYSPWYDLQQGLVSLSCSRAAASRLERLCGVDMGGLDPIRAAKYLDTITKTIQKNSQENMRLNLRRGFLPTIANIIYPIFSKSGKGTLNTSTLEGNPNIIGIEDLMLHIRRMSAAIGTTPSLIGFGDEMTGGLGDGGWQTVSIQAALFSTVLRLALIDGWERIFSLHLYWKFGKIFPEKPWSLRFNSVSSALENEVAGNQEAAVNLGTALTGLMSELKEYGNPALTNMILTDMMRLEEKKVKDILGRDASAGDGGGGGGGDDEKPEPPEPAGKDSGEGERSFDKSDDDDDKKKGGKGKSGVEEAVRSPEFRELLTEAVSDILAGE